jgi:cold-inducible RNA-binding protein
MLMLKQLKLRDCMSNKLYVGNLSFSTTEDKLKDSFSEFGTVESVKIIKDEIGRSKGFGFVEMSSEAEAQEAAKSLNGKELDGRTIRVDIARPQEARPRTSGPRGGGERRGGFRSNNW